MGDRVAQCPLASAFHFGPQGETRQRTNAGGAVVDTYVYTAYGVPVASTGTDPNPFRFGGQVGYYTETNPQCQTVLCGARWYSPVLGRWLSRDPIGYEGGPNLYEYCDGDPANGVDPDGEDWEDFKRWYHGGMGGFSGWVDRIVGFGFAGSWGDVAGLHDSGKASAGAVVWGGLKFSGMLVCNAVSLTRGASGLPLRIGLPGCAARAGGGGGGFARAATGARFVAAGKVVPGSVLGHIFRNEVGHVNPRTTSSKRRFLKLFERVAADPRNLRTDAVLVKGLKPEAVAAGRRYYTYMTTKGKQIWVIVTRDGSLRNAGVNLPGQCR